MTQQPKIPKLTNKQAWALYKLLTSKFYYRETDYPCMDGLDSLRKYIDETSDTFRIEFSMSELPKQENKTIVFCERMRVMLSGGGFLMLLNESGECVEIQLFAPADMLRTAYFKILDD